ncbi:MAG TPA: panthothenate synthetase [Deltaproteobacteria bacterium]|nr:panthothenate synthetase [Deltaproteobacteria bacterium]
MRFILHASLPAEKFNRSLIEGRAGQIIRRILEETKPEAAYFCTKDGKRSSFLIINMEKACDIPKYAEPWFLNFDATVEFLPAMNSDDLQKAGLEEIAKKWR